MNHIGDLLQSDVTMLLIGERPGLATHESLSIYFAYKPRSGQTDAHRNLISNIHRHGVSLDQAASRATKFLERILTARQSGVEIKEEISSCKIRKYL
jgi:ethanolamine ammonia-lyase small subunit